MQQLRPFSLPFKSVFLILHVTPLSCGLLNTVFIRCDSKLLQCQILDSVTVDRGLGCTGDHSIDMVVGTKIKF